MPEREFMRKAIEEALEGIKAGHGGPFGAVIVKGGKIIASAHNTVLRDNDPTKHAEVKAISDASKLLKSFDLAGCSIYSTTEPCPMCFSAIHWAKLDTVIYGTVIEDVKRLGFNELTIPSDRMKKEGNSQVEIIGGFMREECESLLKEWSLLPERRVY